MAKRARSSPSTPSGRFDVEAYLNVESPQRQITKYRGGQIVFSQGDAAADVKYLQKGAVKLSVLSHIGKEAVVAMLGPGDFLARGRWRVSPSASGRQRP